MATSRNFCQTELNTWNWIVSRTLSKLQCNCQAIQGRLRNFAPRKLKMWVFSRVALHSDHLVSCVWFSALFRCTKGQWSNSLCFCTVHRAGALPLWPQPPILCPGGTKWIWHGKKFHMRLHSLVCIYFLIKTSNKITIENRLIKATKWYTTTFVGHMSAHKWVLILLNYLLYLNDITPWGGIAPAGVKKYLQVISQKLCPQWSLTSITFFVFSSKRLTDWL